VQQVYKVVGGIENLAVCTMAKVEESSEWTFVVNSRKNRPNFYKGPGGKPLFRSLYDMYTVTLNELKAILKTSAQARQSGVVNITSVTSTAQDYF
jgi:hypothetical protein